MQINNLYRYNPSPHALFVFPQLVSPPHHLAPPLSLVHFVFRPFTTLSVVRLSLSLRLLLPCFFVQLPLFPPSPRLLVRSCLCISDPCIYSPPCTLTLIRSCIVACVCSYLVSCFLISLLPVAPSSLRPLIPLPLVLSSSPPIPVWTPRHFPSASVRTPTIWRPPAVTIPCGRPPAPPLPTQGRPCRPASSRTSRLLRTAESPTLINRGESRPLGSSGRDAVCGGSGRDATLKGEHSCAAGEGWRVRCGPHGEWQKILDPLVQDSNRDSWTHSLNFQSIILSL